MYQIINSYHNQMRLVIKPVFKLMLKIAEDTSLSDQNTLGSVALTVNNTVV